MALEAPRETARGEHATIRLQSRRGRTWETIRVAILEEESGRTKIWRTPDRATFREVLPQALRDSRRRTRLPSRPIPDIHHDNVATYF